jgi:hypothetical protein
MRKKPLMMLDTDVCDAKPRAIPRIPAAPRRGARLNPSSRSTVTRMPATPVYQKSLPSTRPRWGVVVRAIHRRIHWAMP